MFYAISKKIINWAFKFFSLSESFDVINQRLFFGLILRLFHLNIEIYSSNWSFQMIRVL